jgi:hypothetical protein
VHSASYDSRPTLLRFSRSKATTMRPLYSSSSRALTMPLHSNCRASESHAAVLLRTLLRRHCRHEQQASIDKTHRLRCLLLLLRGVVWRPTSAAITNVQNETMPEVAHSLRTLRIRGDAHECSPISTAQIQSPPKTRQCSQVPHRS